MTKEIKDLEKACRETAAAGSEMLKAHVKAYTKDKADKAHDDAEEASHQSLAGRDKGTPDAHKKAERLHRIAADAHAAIGDKQAEKWHRSQAEIHHKAYQRHNASGTVSQIQAKGPQVQPKNGPKSVQTTTRKTPKHNEKAALKSALEQSKQAFSTDKYADHQKALEAHKSAHEKATSPEVKEKHADYIRMHTAESHVAKDKPK